MISFVRGILIDVSPDKAYIDVSGIGFGVGMSVNGLSKLPPLGKEVNIHTYFQVREDGMALYGFVESEEKDLFVQLIGVSGVGPKVALAALSTYAPDSLKAAIVAQDTDMISRIPGIGKKTASRIVLELKEAFEMPTSISAQAQNLSSPLVQQVSEALLAMGFTLSEAELALQGAPDETSESKLLQYALKRLGSS